MISPQIRQSNTPPLPKRSTSWWWAIWANPIFRRYCRSRLRVRGLGISLLIVVIIAGFLFFMSRSIGFYRSNMSLMDAERLSIIPLLVFQGIILFFLGTGQVAGGMTAEADEGVLDYQRLAPMSPLAKVLGYLFGLPVREYVLFFSTLPFSAWALWRGGVPVEAAAQLYTVILSSAILYHLTGLVAGTVVKNRRWAFLIAMGAVFVLYTAVPQMARFGLVYFKYLTIQPVFEEMLPIILPRDAGTVFDLVQRLMPTARFFDIDLPEWIFTVLSQGVFILTAIVMLWRRWRRTESHLLGKAWAVGLFAWIQVLLLGNALPLVESGMLFPSREVSRRFLMQGLIRDPNWKPEGMEAVAMISLYGIVTLAILWILTLMITPNADCQLRGWRRARKLNRKTLALGSDPATAFWWVAPMAVIGATGWHKFTVSVVESRWFPGHEVPPIALLAFGLAFFTGGLGFHALLEGKGGRTIGLATILIGIVPIMTGAVVAASSDRLAAPAAWLIGMSPASSPIYASGSVLSLAELPQELIRSMPRAFWFWQSVSFAITLWLIASLRRSRKQVAEGAQK